jgi:hypothetical protein
LPLAPLAIWKVPPVSVIVPVPAFRALLDVNNAVPVVRRNWLPLPVELLAVSVVPLRSRSPLPLAPRVPLMAVRLIVGR